MNSSPDKLPQHVAVIMDGNSRWAKKSGLSRLEGYSGGSNAVEESVRYCLNRGIRALTLYAFSTENWHRSAEDVNFLMGLLHNFLLQKEEEMVKEKISLRWIGRKDRIAFETREIFERIIEKTKSNKNLILTLAIDYGARDEILRAMRKILHQFEREKFDIELFNESNFQSFLDTKDLPELDLLIRTSGEKRISNFLLYQAAYSELHFSEKHWPEFTGEDFDLAVTDFANRIRNYGKNRSS